LDDYLSLSTPHFSQIPTSKAHITTFTDSLSPYPHPSTTNAQRDALAARLKPFTVLCTMRERTPFPDELFQRLPNLKLLLCTGTQFNTFDIKAAKEQGITIATVHGCGRSDRPKTQPLSKTNITKGAAHPTTQHTWAMILALARNVSADDRAMRQGGWQTGCAMGLTGKVLGIVGLGRLGVAVARIGVLAWGMRIICWSENLTQAKADSMAQSVRLSTKGEDGGKIFKSVEKEELFKDSDVLSLHYQLSERSKGIVGEKELGLMKKSALLINTSRGPLIDEVALLKAVGRGQIRGVALDTFEIEPLPADSLWRSPKWGTEGTSHVLTTPHMGYMDEENMNNFYAEQAEQLERWLDGKELLNLL